MGVRGLTTFINNRSHLYLKEYKLHDCSVVLDGNSIAANLYKWHCKSNDCFGGDYDKFGNVVYNFFEVLSQCNIIPIVIFDGGYEKRKVVTVLNRMKNRIQEADRISAINTNSSSVFPLFLRDTFTDIVLELGIKAARCEFEGDMEIANIAKLLECPVLSYDSDFYIFGCLYIPFSTVNLAIRTGKCTLSKKSYNYLSCQIYQIETFLKSYGGLDKNNLPLLAVILGNDYVKGTLFRPFFRNLKMQKCNGNQSDQQKRIKSVMIWLQNETLESAIKNVLSRFKSFKRQYILKQIENAMKGYYDINSDLLEFLDIKLVPKEKIPVQFKDLENEIKEVIDGEESDSSDIQNVSDDNEIEDFSDKDSDTNEKEFADECNVRDTTLVTDVFLQNFRKCQYPSCFMDMIVQHRYYCIPQVENEKSEHSHIFSLNILSFIYKVLNKKKSKRLTVISRRGRFNLHFKKIVDIDSNDFCTFEEIQKMSLEERTCTLIKILELDSNFLYNLNILSSDWQLFVISIKYTLQKISLDKSLIISLVLCFFILNYIDPHVGFCRTSKTFDKKFANFKQNISNKNVINVNKHFENLTLSDCMHFMNKMIMYFQMDIKLISNYRTYDKLLVHSMSQIQSIFLHIKHLNCLLNFPFPNLKMHKIFDGTFIYNMTNNLRKRSSINAYFQQLLPDCPGIMTNLNAIFDIVDKMFDFTNVTTSYKLKRKRKKKSPKSISEVEIQDNQEPEEHDYVDPNNPYSLLSVL